MNTKFRGSILISAVLAALMVVSFGVVSAQDDEEDLPNISDDRVNNFDLAAPVAVYCEYDYPFEDDPNVGVLQDIELWALTDADDGLFSQVAVVSGDALSAAIQDLEGDASVLAQSSGYTLWLLDEDTLQVIAPADFEGKVYDFSWDLGSTVRC